MMRHLASYGREEGQIASSLALHLQLTSFNGGTDIVIGNDQIGFLRRAGGVDDGVELTFPPRLKRLGRGREMSVTIDDHNPSWAAYRYSSGSTNSSSTDMRRGVSPCWKAVSSSAWMVRRFGAMPYGSGSWPTIRRSAKYFLLSGAAPAPLLSRHASHSFFAVEKASKTDLAIHGCSASTESLITMVPCIG